MDNMKQPAIDTSTTYFKVIVAILIGLMAKVSYEFSKGRKLSILSWFGIMGLSVFTGYMSSVICDYYGYETASKIVVPLATLFGEKIFEFVFLKFGDIFKVWLKNALNNILGAINKDSDNQ